jgi:hypothetical protein
MVALILMLILSVAAAVLAWQLVLHTLPAAIKRYNEGTHQ